ncbi:acylglycerol lipase [Malassezia sp. CBS 17886]|nr:acylglycerol lipase [Malassezia sp. CBS 17886]
MGYWSFLVRAQLYLATACVGYIALTMTLGLSGLQRHYLFLHKISFPFWPKFEEPHAHGLSPGQARNLQLTSTGGVQIGVWHHIPDSLYHDMVAEMGEIPENEGAEFPASVYEAALRDYPTFIYLHGNAMNRAAPFRVESYKLISNLQDANVIALDYRGYGDSESFPTEEGVIDDAYTAVQYVREHAEDPATGKQQGLALVGQSLGTGIAAQCALRLSREGVRLDALVLLAAFKAVRPMVAEFRIGGVVPLLGWLDFFPYKEQMLDSLLQYSFNTSAALGEIITGHDGAHADIPPPSVVLMHAENDDVIPVSHADELYSMVELYFRADERNSPYQVWRSSVPDVGQVTAVIPRMTQSSMSIARVPGARAVLPRAALFTYMRLEQGGHNHLFDTNADLVQLTVPKCMLGPRAVA